MNPWDEKWVTPAPWEETWASPYEQQAKQDTNSQNLLASIGGAMKAPYVGVRQALGMDQPGEVEDWKRSMAGLWSTPMGKAGTVVGGAATAVPLAFIPGANTVAGAAAGGLAFGAAQPVTEGQTRLTNAIEGMGGNVAGKYVGDALGAVASRAFAGKKADLATQQAVNAVRDSTLREAQGAGYVIPPTQAAPGNPGALNRLGEGIAGKIQTGQLAGIKNQPVTDRLARKAIDLPEDVPLTPENIQTVRSTAGQVYKGLKDFGTVRADPEFRTAFDGITAEYRQLAADFPSQSHKGIESLMSDLSKPQFNSGSLVELVKRLRTDGYANLKAFNDPEKKALGQVQLGAQNAIEDLIDRNLAASGNADFLPIFRKARTLIAKTHTVENALEESTGKVVASKIGKEYSKGRPLTGELATIGKIAEAFPKAVQNVNTSMPGLSPLDAAGSMAALIGAVGTGNPHAAWLAAAPLARPVVRAGLLSGPWQRGMVKPQSYEVGLLGQGANAAIDSDAMRRLLQSLGMSLPAMQQ